ncbi:MAG: ATP-dependent RecD-like DNA helicase [Ruminococcus sp.]|jgi:exodeoxyribonuclease V alpha subunit|nr:ATP-dependent RecD-like DNA helicase [Ruminococcus sp.]
MRRELKNPETIEGTVDSVTYHNEDNGFSVIVIDFHGSPLTVTGELGNLSEGEEVKLYGEFGVHQKYGEQFYAVSVERSLPSGSTAMMKYLSSGTVKGIGKKTAKQIIDKFGENAFDILENHPEELEKLEGMSKKKAYAINEDFKRIYGIRELSLFLAEFDISPGTAATAWKIWGHFAREMVAENPYILCAEDIGLSFKKADKIAEKLNIPLDSKERLVAGAEYVLKNAGFDGGHTALPLEAFSREFMRMLNASENDVQTAIDTGTEKQLLFIAENDSPKISLYKYYDAEKYIADRLKISARSHNEYDYSKLIEVEEAGKGIKYADKQKEAIGYALTSGLTILTGGPGTGKTTTLNAIISLYKGQGKVVQITAPTGKAAKRISELTGYPAKTIHRLLEVTYDAGDKLVFVHDENKRLECDVCVIDEMSMVDSELFSALLRALKKECRLVLVGDSDQLPSVGAGNVLHDIIKSCTLPVVALNEVFRQAKESGIVTNAHKIVSGEYPELKAEDFFFLQRLDSESAVKLVTELVCERLPKAYDLSPLDDIQVLSPARKGEVGIESLNKRLQEVLNPPEPDAKAVKGGLYSFRVNDKVMQTSNNYDIVWTQGNDSGTGIFNGEIGIIRSIVKEEDSVVIDFDGKIADYSLDMLRELELAYAITVHKSQGSEFDAVVLPLLGGYEKLYCRNLLYTAVTRAKKLLVIVGSRNVVCKMVDNNLQTMRYTLLEEFLKNDS